MRAIGTEMMTFGVGLPVLYLAIVDVFLGGFTPAAVMFVGAVSFLLIALGREMRIRGAPSTGSQRTRRGS